MKALASFGQFESSAPHAPAILGFELAALLLPLTGNTGLRGDDGAVK